MTQRYLAMEVLSTGSAGAIGLGLKVQRDGKRFACATVLLEQITMPTRAQVSRHAAQHERHERARRLRGRNALATSCDRPCSMASVPASGANGTASGHGRIKAVSSRHRRDTGDRACGCGGQLAGCVGRTASRRRQRRLSRLGRQCRSLVRVGDAAKAVFQWMASDATRLF